MFEKLRRAKSFIHRSKCEEEKPKHPDLDLSETSHLRRNVSIDNEILKQQHNLARIQEYAGKKKKTTLKRQVSKSNEHLHDQVVEQLRKLNFGDSYSKKHAQQLRESSEEPQEFVRRHPAYLSERNYRRKSFGSDEKAKNSQKNSKSEKYVHHRKSGDVMSNFDRKNPVHCSETRVGMQINLNNIRRTGRNDIATPRMTGEEAVNNFDRRSPAYRSETRLGVEKDTHKSVTNESNTPQRTEDVRSNCDLRNPAYRSESGFQVEGRVRSPTRSSDTQFVVEGSSTGNIHEGNFDRRNPAYWSERSILILRQKCSEQSDFTTTRVVGGDGDFLLNRKSVDLSYNFDRRNPAYVSDRSVQKARPDLLEKSGIKSLFQKVKGTKKNRNKDSCDTSSVSSGSASSSATSTLIDRDHPPYVAEESFTQNQKTVSANESGFSSGSTGSSAASCSIDRNHSAYFSETEAAEKQVTVLTNEDQSRKRRHNLTKSNFDRNRPACLSEKVTDVLKKDGDNSVIRSDKR